MRLLVRLRDGPDPDLREKRIAGRDLPVLAFKVIGRLAAPDVEDVADGLGEHFIAVESADPERFRIGFERARADAEQKPSLQEMVQHGRLGRDEDGVGVGKVGGAGAELDLLRVGNQACLEKHRIRDALGRVGDMLADIGLRITEPVGQDNGLAVLLQNLGIVPVQPVDRHGEEAELHRRRPWYRRAGTGRHAPR